MIYLYEIQDLHNIGRYQIIHRLLLNLTMILEHIYYIYKVQYVFEKIIYTTREAKLKFQLWV